MTTPLPKLSEAQKPNPFFYRPRKGDVWEVQFPGKRKQRKTVGSVYLSWYLRLNGQDVRRPTVVWDRLPKGRYTQVRVKVLLRHGKLVSRKGCPDLGRAVVAELEK